jgi:hypothetical protein
VIFFILHRTPYNILQFSDANLVWSTRPKIQILVDLDPEDWGTYSTVMYGKMDFSILTGIDPTHRTRFNDWPYITVKASQQTQFYWIKAHSPILYLYVGTYTPPDLGALVGSGPYITGNFYCLQVW